MIVLDASAVLALLYGEPGHEMVGSVLDHACASTVNLAEVVGRFARDGHPSDRVISQLQASPVEWVPFDVVQAARAGGLLPVTRSLGLALGDRACLALALTRALPVMTADTAWSRLDLGVEVRLVR